MSTIIKKLRVYAMSLIFIGGIIAGCSDINDASLSDSERLTHIELQTPNSATKSVAEPTGAGGEGDGTATLMRNNNSISVRVQSTGLTAGNAYTAWFIISEPDPDGSFIVVNAAGNHVGNSGMSTFAGSLATGSIGDPNGFDILVNNGDGSFDDPRGSTVIIHIVNHGPLGKDGPGTIDDNINGIFGALAPPDGLSQEYIFTP